MTDEIQCSGGSDINIDGTARCSECKRPTLVCVEARSKPEVPLDPADYVANFKLGPRPFLNNATNAPGKFLPWWLCGCGVMAPTAPCYMCRNPVEHDEDDAKAEVARITDIELQIKNRGAPLAIGPTDIPPPRATRSARDAQTGRTLLAVAFAVFVIWGVAASIISANPRAVDTRQLD